MQSIARVGLILMRADWFACGEAQPILGKIEADTAEMVRLLSRHFQIHGPWIVDTPEALQVCQKAVRSADLDMVLLAFQTWTEDAHLVGLLQALGSLPLVLWCYLPWRRLARPASYAEVLRGSGPVGAFGALGTLRNLDVPFLFTFGALDDPRLMQDLLVAGRAAVARQALRSARFGLLPSPNERMQSSYVDETRLRADFGPVVQYLPVSEYKRAVAALDSARVQAYLQQVRARFAVREVADETLEQAARMALGLADLASEHHLDVLAVNDAEPELYRAFHMRPALYPDLLDPLPVIFQPEGDLGAATANIILQRLTGSPTLFMEVWFWDEARNQLVGGHGGLQNPALAAAGQAWVSPDNAFCRIRARTESGNAPANEDDSSGPGHSGAQFQFLAGPGRVTLFQLRATPRSWQAIALSGVCLEGQPWIEGCSHAILRLDAPMAHFLNRLAEVGATQHWVMAYGSVIPELQALCQMEKIPIEVISY